MTMDIPVWPRYSELNELHLKPGDKDNNNPPWTLIDRKRVGGGVASISIWESPKGGNWRIVWDRTEMDGRIFMNVVVPCHMAKQGVRAFFDTIDDGNCPPWYENQP